MAYGMAAWVEPVLRRDYTAEGRAWASINGSGFVIPLALRPGGAVRVDGSSNVRRTLSCDVVAPITSPTVDPFQAEVRVEYGVISGIREAWTTVGTFMLQTAKETSPGIVHLEGRDRWQRLVDARYERPVTTSGSIVAAITAAVQGADPRIPSLVVDPAVVDSTHPSSLWERDRDDQVAKLAKSIGCAVYFRPDGTPVLAPVPDIPDVNAPGTWSLGRGNGGAKVSSARKLDRGPVYNAAIAMGEAVDGSPGVWAIARDTSGGVTTYGGGFGMKPRYYRSRFITSTGQAQSAADALRSKIIGRAWEVDAVGLVRPDLEVGDTLRVEVEPERWQTHSLQGWPIPLGAGTSRYTLRSTAAAVEDETA